MRLSRYNLPTLQHSCLPPFQQHRTLMAEGCPRMTTCPRMARAVAIRGQPSLGRRRTNPRNHRHVATNCRSNARRDHHLEACRNAAKPRTCFQITLRASLQSQARSRTSQDEAVGCHDHVAVRHNRRARYSAMPACGTSLASRHTDTPGAAAKMTGPRSVFHTPHREHPNQNGSGSSQYRRTGSFEPHACLP